MKENFILLSLIVDIYFVFSVIIVLLIVFSFDVVF